MSDSFGYGRRSISSNDDDIPEPTVYGWQLIGDSQFLRFSEQFLGKSRKRKDKLAYLGLCVSGQKAGDLLERVKDDFNPISDRVIIMIGTNDLLKGTNVTELRSAIQKLVLYLRNEAKVSQVKILTIPPVPRLARSSDHWKTLKAYNDHIKSFLNIKGGIDVIDAYASFIKNDELSRSSLSLSRNSPLLSRSSPPSSRNSPSSSRSSLVSYSSGSSNPLLRNSNNSLNIPVYNSNVGKIRTNLRIHVREVSTDRKIYLLDSDKEDDNEDDTENSGNVTMNTIPIGKRTSFSSRFTTPNPKRRSIGSGSYDIAQDDHNDSFHSNDSLEPVDQAEDIILDYFEEYFDNDRNRPDLIHLNSRGLRVIERLIYDAIGA